jgi:hypothetical protein
MSGVDLETVEREYSHSIANQFQFLKPGGVLGEARWPISSSYRRSAARNGGSRGFAWRAARAPATARIVSPATSLGRRTESGWPSAALPAAKMTARESSEGDRDTGGLLRRVGSRVLAKWRSAGVSARDVDLRSGDSYPPLPSGGR